MAIDRYTPELIPANNLEELHTNMHYELLRISSMLGVLADKLEQTHFEPEKVDVGDIVSADGVDFDPGQGEGLYIRKEWGWVKLQEIVGNIEWTITSSVLTLTSTAPTVLRSEIEIPTGALFLNTTFPQVI